MFANETDAGELACHQGGLQPTILKGQLEKQGAGNGTGTGMGAGPKRYRITSPIRAIKWV